ncbi:MAG: hypothetical protein K2Y17_08415 [Qipengyuania sp.]|nr:hypothetical protein [Qipengyuania sp.]
MRLTSRFNPAGGIADFWTEIRRPTPYRWPILGLSLLCSFGLLYWVMRESVLVPPAPPKVSFISTFEAGRSDAQILASNLENQRRKERREAEQARREAEVKAAYRALGRATGLDVDAMERKIAQDQAAAEAAANADRASVPVAAPAH